VWKDIEGFEGFYQVSNLGKVRSLDAVIECKSRTGNPFVLHTKGQIIRPQVYKSGYFYVHLCHKQKGRNIKIHRLVAEAFIPNPNNLPCINHKDEDKANNSSANLEWCDVMYNNNYGTHYDRMAVTRQRPVEQLTLDGQHVAYYASRKDAELKSGGKFHAATIIGVLSGRRKTAYGYQWRNCDL
jgi:hypothetical protein